jgi:alcohol dehydrogenase, propanol-preferring
MRAMAVRTPAPASARPLEPDERPDPVPGPDDLVVEVAACGVCRTDLQIAEGDLAARRLPIVPGHQVVGRVVAVGADVRGWAVGDRAGVAWLGHTCGRCRYCTSGRENLCESARFTGWDRDGGYAERLAVEAAFALRLPDGFADLDAAPLLCGGVIGYRSLKVSGIEPGGALGLYGFGASALLALQVAVHWGCDVHVVTRSAAERDRARSLGARWAGAPGSVPPVALDAAVTFAPVGSLVVEALSALAPGGTVAVNAIHLDHVPEFSYDLLWRERSLRSVANFTRADANEFLALAAAIPVVTAVEEHPLAEANRALARLADGRVAGAAVLVP